MVGLWIVLKSVELYERELLPVLFCYFFVHAVIPHRILVKVRLMMNACDELKVRGLLMPLVPKWLCRNVKMIRK